MATTIDTYIDCLGIDLEDLYEMSAEERETYYKNVIRDLSDEELADLEKEYKETLDYLADELYVYQDELEDIINSNDSSTEEIARAERALDDIDALFEFAEEESTSFGDAQTEVAEENVDATDGEDYTFSPTDPDNGQEYVIDATSSDVDGSTVLEDPHAEEEASGKNWVDTDGDGYTDTLADEDGNGIADNDTNNDNIIDETDMLDTGSSTANQTITIELEQGDTIELASYDADDGTTRWKITKEDGTTYYLTIKGAPDIRFSGDYNFDSTGIEWSWGEELLNRVYESETIESSFGDILEVADPDATDEEYYTIVDLADQPSNKYTETVTTTDIENERDYTINCNGSTADSIDLTFPEGAELSFAPGDEDGTLVITVEYNGHTSTITITGFSSNDSLDISGGNLDSDDLTNLGLIYMSDGTTLFNDASALFLYENIQIASVTV